MYSLGDLFGQYIDASTLELFSGAAVENCALQNESRSLELSLLCADYIPRKAIISLENKIKSALKLNSISLNTVFNAASLNRDAISDAVDTLKIKKAAVNGYFTGAEYSLEGDVISIKLAHGGLDTITACGFDNELKNYIKQHFSRNTEIEFTGQTAAVEIELPPLPEAPPVFEQYESAPVYAPKKEEPKVEIDFSKPPKDSLPIYLDSAEVFLGRKVDKNIKPLKEIAPHQDENESVKIAAWGEVFGCEIADKDTKNGKKMVTAKFFFSDGTNSFAANVKKFFDPKYSKDMAGDAHKFKKSLSPLKDGAIVIVNGDYGYDNWTKDFIVDVKALATVKKYEETDNFEGLKRVELHCHTNMSAKDAVSSAGDIISLAHKWGHRAVAITDHGVVQAYPAVAAAVSKIRKKDPEFKAIYGVEAYFVDDIRHNIADLTPKQLAKLRSHQIILVKDLKGLRNLYELISYAHLDDFSARPITLRSKLDKLREGLIIGSACELGELYKAIIDGKSDEELLEIADYYDYLEIQPLSNNAFMVRESSSPDKVDKKSGQVIPNRFKHVTSLEVIKDFNRKVVELADKLGKMVVATGDVHFLKKEDGIIRQIVMAGQGFDDIENQAPLYFKTTDEMLNDFSYFGERAREFVIDNPNKIADMISGDVIPVPEGNYPPVIEGSDELLKQICWDNAHKIYGDNLHKVVENRLTKELNSIINNGFSIMYISAQKLVAYSEEKGYLVGSRGSVGSSFAATMAGISEVNPLPPHYVCPKCRNSEFFTKGEVGSGFDLPEKDCPLCGTPYDRNGHDIPFETFLGFKGDKVPDIDLNFADEVQGQVQKYTESLFGSENVFKAGTISTIAEKTAFGFAKAYAEKMNITLSTAELNRLAGKVEKSKVKTTTGQHPAGMIIVPDGMKIYDFCPVQHPADDVKSDIVTTHFDFHSIHDTILKLDELGHVVPTTYKYLEEYSGIPVTKVSMSDPDVYSLFTSPAALGVTAEDLDSKTGTLSLPEFGTRNTRDMLMDCRPQNFSDLLQISGLSHGTGVWHGNAKSLIEEGTCTISTVIGTRDNIMVYLIYQGMEEGRAFKITETVRKGLYAKGKISEEDWQGMAEDMRKVNVPEWYIDSCKKIEYMFPKAHAAAYVIAALRLAWYKVHRPLEFYCAYFTARPEDVDVKTLMGGLSKVRQVMYEIKAKGKEAAKKEQDIYNNLMIFNEMMSRGIEILPIDIRHSHAMKFVPEDGKMRLPFGALSGVGEKAAYSIYNAAQKGNFISREDFALEAGVSKTIIKELADLGAMADLPDTNQLSMF